MSNILLIILLWKVEKQHMLSIRTQNFISDYVHVNDWGCVCISESLKGNNVGYQSV